MIKNTIKLFGALLSIIAVAQFSQPVMAQTNVRRYTVHIAATAGTTVVTAANAYIATAVVTVSTVGTNPIQITNTAGEVKFQSASTALGTVLNFATGSQANVVPIVGIKIVAPATAVFDVMLTYYIN